MPKTSRPPAPRSPGRRRRRSPSWNRRYSPSGHGCWNRRCSSDVIDAGHATRVGSAAPAPPASTVATRCPSVVVDRTPDQAAVARDGDRLLRVQVPAVEAHRAVEPERVVEAEAGELRGRTAAPGTSGTPCRAAGSRSRTRAAPRAAAGRRRRRAAAASSASACPSAGAPPRKVGASPMRRSSGGWLLDPGHRVPAQLRRARSRTQSCSSGQLVGARRRAVADRRARGRRGSRGTRRSRISSGRDRPG